MTESGAQERNYKEPKPEMISNMMESRTNPRMNTTAEDRDDDAMEK